MRKTLLILSFCAIFLFAPSDTHAQALGTSGFSVRAFIATLQQQVDVLRAQLAANTINISDNSVRSLDDYYVTKFYDGPYTALYETDGYHITLQYGTYSNIHQLIWNMFTDIAGPEAVMDNVVELRVFNDENVYLSAFTDQRNIESGGDEWIVGINTAGVRIGGALWQQDMSMLLLHEYSHILLYNTEGITDVFSTTYWSNSALKRAARIRNFNNADARDDAVYQYYKQNEDDFVSEYAATNATEDMVESFVHFVLYDDEGDSIVSEDKRNFFYRYPNLVKEREALRERMFKYTL